MDATVLYEARMIVQDFLRVRSGELVSIYTDAARQSEAEALALAAEEAGAATVLLDIGYQVAESLRDARLFVEPPAHLQAIMNASNANVLVVDEEYVLRLDHSIGNLFQTGEDRSFFSIDPGLGTWGITPEDAARVDAAAARILDATKHADNVRVTSRKGTDVTLSIKGRACIYIGSVPRRGQPYCYPAPLWGELNWAPIKEETKGVVVVDGITEATGRLKNVAAPVTWHVEQGSVVDVHGGTNAGEFRDVLTVDEGACVIGELGIGINPRAIFGTHSEKALLGAVHFGLGNNHLYPGGDVRSSIHVDGGVRDATIEVDGCVVVADGSIVV